MLKHILASFVFGLGMLPLFGIAFAYWLRRTPGVYEWAISGPFPFDQLGGGPAMLAFMVASVFLALLLMGIGVMLHRRPRN